MESSLLMIDFKSLCRKWIGFMANWVDWICGRTFPESLRQELDAKISTKRLPFSTEWDTTDPSKDDMGGKENVLKFLPMVLANGQNLRLPEGHEASPLHFRWNVYAVYMHYWYYFDELPYF